jgi:hypothetical protein
MARRVLHFEITVIGNIDTDAADKLALKCIDDGAVQQAVRNTIGEQRPCECGCYDWHPDGECGCAVGCAHYTGSHEVVDSDAWATEEEGQK